MCARCEAAEPLYPEADLGASFLSWGAETALLLKTMTTVPRPIALMMFLSHYRATMQGPIRALSSPANPAKENR